MTGHLHFETLALCNTCTLQHLHFATLALCNTCTLQHLQFAKLAICNTCNLKGGECPVIPPVHWKGVTFPRQRSSRTLKTLSNWKGFYRVFSAVERFLYLRDFFYYFDRFFTLCLRDFLNKCFKDFKNRDLRDLCNVIKEISQIQKSLNS